MNHSSLLLEYLNDTTSRGILLVNRAGQIEFINPRFWQLLKLSPENEQGESFADFIQTLPNRPDWSGPLPEWLRPRFIPFLQYTLYTSIFCFHPGLWLQISGRPMAQGGYALTITDISLLQQTMQALRQSDKNTIMALADLAENRDQDTGAHVLKVARMTHEIALELQKDPHFDEPIADYFLSRVGLASILHDVGKITTPDAILLKPGPLTPEERRIMQEHSTAGDKILKKIKALQFDESYLGIAGRIARHHHERYGGGGYPDGLQERDIPLEARIVAATDVFDALTSWRPYKDPWPTEKALAFILENSGTLFDPAVVAALQRVLARRQERCLVQWQESMSVGHALLDNDHHILIDLINQLAIARQRLDGITMEFVLDELYNYTGNHFRREEAYMEQIHFPELSQHREIHQIFTDKVAKIRHHFLRNPDPQLSDISDNLMEMLGGWLQGHILQADRRYVEFISTAEIR